MSFGYDPILILESVGYTEREAAFLYLVAVHSGYFLRRQYGRFIQRERGAIAEQLLRKACARGHVQSIACGQARFIYQIVSRKVYRAIGLAASQHRRLNGDAQIKRRLMVLDFVLDHLGQRILDSTDVKRDFFCMSFGIEGKTLTHARVFSDEFPILPDAEKTVRFTYFDEGALSTSAFENFLRRYRAVFAALSGFELLYLADADRSFERAARIFAALYPEARALGVTSVTPRGVDHFLEYLRARENYDTEKRPITLPDLEVLREGEKVYTTLEHRALCAAWINGSTNADRIRQRFQKQGPRAKFTTVVLPYGYPLNQLKYERAPQPELGSSDRSVNPLRFTDNNLQNNYLAKEAGR